MLVKSYSDSVSNKQHNIDLEHIFSHTKELWDEIRNKRLFITGGTGFFGKWLLESFVWANEKLSLNTEFVVLTRNFDAFKMAVPHLANNPALKFHIGDVRDFRFPNGEFTHIIHAASASAVGKFMNEDPVERFDTIVIGTRYVLDFAIKCKAHEFLYTSSGNIYGKQPIDISHVNEDYNGAPMPDDSNAALGIGKRSAEFLCMSYAKKNKINIKFTRCFSFVGPYLQLDVHYAIGNFIRDALNGGPIRVKGDGTPFRSYLYAADLVIWLWTILFKGKACYPYNVGSEEAITIKDLAYKVSEVYKDLTGKHIDVIIEKQPDMSMPVERYVPSTKRAQTELGLRQYINLEEAIKRTILYAQANGLR